MLVSLGSMNGKLILGFVWFLAVLGILSGNFSAGTRNKIIQILIYLGMG
ncbi:MAG: hypothetical protein ACNYPE_06660 [Candidatus Azotimanducaceae bacterium WSBS_2022_MAG_OTU7]